ncbi:MAG TPA: hypothetical protein VNL16_07925 [Chloroflexota bacterium]|nr:hypothetical protein [Chloroflexota bacterium]
MKSTTRSHLPTIGERFPEGEAFIELAISRVEEARGETLPPDQVEIGRHFLGLIWRSWRDLDANLLPLLAEHLLARLHAQRDGAADTG